jgi:hypothetical protein
MKTSKEKKMISKKGWIDYRAKEILTRYGWNPEKHGLCWDESLDWLTYCEYVFGKRVLSKRFVNCLDKVCPECRKPTVENTEGFAGEHIAYCTNINCSFSFHEDPTRYII